jgi:hypothetical protein
MNGFALLSLVVSALVSPETDPSPQGRVESVDLGAPVCGTNPVLQSQVLNDARFRFSSSSPRAQAWRSAAGFVPVSADSISLVVGETQCAQIRDALTAIRTAAHAAYLPPPVEARQLYAVRLPGHFFVFDEAVEPSVTLILNDALTLVIRRFK